MFTTPFFNRGQRTMNLRSICEKALLDLSSYEFLCDLSIPLFPTHTLILPWFTCFTNSDLPLWFRYVLCLVRDGAQMIHHNWVGKTSPR